MKLALIIKSKVQNVVLNRITGSDYLKNILTLLSGSFIIQFLPLLFSPITSRIYQPADYGIFGIYMSIVGFISVFVTSHYSHAIMLQNRLKNTINLMLLAETITVIVSFSVLSLLFFLPDALFTKLEIGNLSFIWWFIPLSIFLNGTFSVLAIWTNKNKKYKRLTYCRITHSVFFIIITLTVGLAIPGPLGLFIGSIGGTIISLIILLFNTLKEDSKYMKLFSFSQVKKLIKREKKFLLYTFPSDFIYTLCNQIPILVLTKFSTPQMVGFYGMSERVIGLPLTLIGSSVSEVFRQKSAQDYLQTGNCRSVVRDTFKTLFVIGLLPTIIILLKGPDLFAFVFGSEWAIAGTYAQILSIMYLLKLAINPISYVYFIAQRQKEDLLIHIYMLGSAFFSLYLGYYFYQSAFAMISFFAINYIIIYLFYLVRSYQLSTKPL